MYCKNINLRGYGQVILTIVLLTAIFVFGCNLHAAASQEKTLMWPERNITMIIPFKPGGGYDICGRIAASFIEKYLPKKVNIVVRNVEGAAGKIGLLELVRAKPDGYTIGVTEVFQIGRTYVLGEAGDIDVTKLTWLGRLDGGGGMMAVGKGGRFKTIAEMKGQEVRISGTSQTNFSALLVSRALGIKPRLINYDLGPDACFAVMRGDADAIVYYAPSMMKQVKASGGKLIPIFIGDEKRDPHYPDIPTAKELGVTGLNGDLLGGAHLLAAPGGMDNSLANMFEDIVRKALSDPGYAQKIEAAGYPVFPLYGRDNLDSYVSSVAKAMMEEKDLLLSLLKK